MEALILIAIFILGTIIGSFLNVVILRYRTGRSVGGRSACFSCGKKLCWHELLPLASFLVQKGRCRSCHSAISWQYPLVELASGLIFLAVFLREGFDQPFRLIFFLVVFSLLLVITAYDIRHKIIPDAFSYSFAVLALLGVVWQAALVVEAGLPYTFIWPNLLAGPILSLPFCLLWLASKGKWIGLGDGKLALGIGWLLGLGYALSAVVFAFWAGALVGICLVVLSQLNSSSRFHRKTELPFAPFLTIATFLVYLYPYTPLDLIHLFS